jgi:ABC-type polysaccharide transport system permease subunit
MLKMQMENVSEEYYSCRLIALRSLGLRKKWIGFGNSRREAIAEALTLMIRSQLAIVVRRLTYWAWQPIIIKILMQECNNKGVISISQLDEIMPAFDQTQPEYCQLFDE